jgi:hypothetical protein
MCELVQQHDHVATVKAPVHRYLVGIAIPKDTHFGFVVGLNDWRRDVTFIAGVSCDRIHVL